MEEQTSDDDIITFKYRQKITTLNCNDICYVETYHIKRTLVVHTKTEEHFYHGTLRDIMGELPNYFIRCHKSFILNPKHIKELDITFSQYMVLFTNNKSCMLSKKFIADPIRLLREKEDYEN
jgi:two-component system response regulator AgrA